MRVLSTDQCPYNTLSGETSPWVLGVVLALGTTIWDGYKAIGEHPKKGKIRWKGLEGKPYEKELKSLGLFTRHWGETSMWFAAPSHREDQGQVPISSLCWPVTGLKRMTWSRVEEGLGWISGGGSSPKGVWALQHALQGTGYSAKPDST